MTVHLPAPARVTGLDGVRSLRGAILGPTGPITVEQDRISAFAETTEDRQWIHVDASRAAAGPFGETIAHGYLTLALVSVFLEQLVEIDGLLMAVNYGLDRVRFPSPVPVGSRLVATADVVAVEDVSGGAQATFRVTIQADGRPKPACVADVLFRYYEA